MIPPCPAVYRALDTLADLNWPEVDYLSLPERPGGLRALYCSDAVRQREDLITFDLDRLTIQATEAGRAAWEAHAACSVCGTVVPFQDGPGMVPRQHAECATCHLEALRCRGLA